MTFHSIQRRILQTIRCCGMCSRMRCGLCRGSSRVRHVWLALALVGALLSLSGMLWAADGAPAAEPLRFRAAVDLALQHSGVMGTVSYTHLTLPTKRIV